MKQAEKIGTKQANCNWLTHYDGVKHSPHLEQGIKANRGEGGRVEEEIGENSC